MRVGFGDSTAKTWIEGVYDPTVVLIHDEAQRPDGGVLCGNFRNPGHVLRRRGCGRTLASRCLSAWVSCLQPGTDPAIIESVTPAGPIGGGLKYLGAYVREIEPDTSMTTNTGGIGKIQGFPPTVTQALRPVADYRVTHVCSWEEPQSANNAQGPYTELDVGAARRAPSAGGGWTGFTVAYSVGSTQYVATWDTGLYACRAGAPVSMMCTPPM
jgi:hypothetical protein